MIGYRLPRSLRVRKRGDYLAIQGSGRKVHARHFVVLVAKGRGRVGITVSSKVGNAVIRNRLKRFVREFVRHARWADGGWIPANRDVVIIARPSAATLGVTDVRQDLMSQQQRVTAC